MKARIFSASAVIICAAAAGAAVRERSTIVDRTNPICGHMCLKVALGLLGQSIELQEIKESMPEHEEGASLADLARFVEARGFRARRFRGSSDDLKRIRGLSIVRVRLVVDGTDYKHYVVTKKVAEDRFLVVDPYDKAVLHDFESLRRIYMGDGVEIVPSERTFHNDGAQPPSPVSESGVEILLDCNELDVGVIEVGEVQEAKIGFSATAKERVVVEKVAASCPCVVGKTDRQSYEPAERGTLEVSVVGGSPGKHVYWIGIETGSGTAALAGVVFTVVKNYAISPSPIVLDLKDADSNSEVRQNIQVFYHGDLGSRLPLTEVRTSHPLLTAKIVKGDWETHETPSPTGDVIQRPPMGEIILELANADTPDALDAQHSLSLVLGGQGQERKVISAAIRIKTSSLYRISPNPLVKLVRLNDGPPMFEETISVESLDKDSPIERLVVTDTDPNSPLAFRVVGGEPGRHLIRLTLNPAFRDSAGAGKYKGTLRLTMHMGARILEDDASYILLFWRSVTGAREPGSAGEHDSRNIDVTR